jgi:lia operon protein LiaG
MKTITKKVLIILILLYGGFLYGQESKIPLQNSKTSRLILKDFNGKLPIEGYNGSEIVIIADSGSFETPERAKGLKAIYPAGTDNTGIGLEVSSSDNQVTIQCLVPFTQATRYSIKVPDNVVLEITSSCERSNDLSVSGMRNEIDIKNCNDITLKDVSGPLVLTTISGNINITFGTISSEKPFSINSVSGDIDITLPPKTPANLELRTITGSFYSDFDLSASKENLKKIGGSVLNFPLNGGGFKFSIITVSGNIYLRKGK